MREEFNLCIERGVHALPVGATGYMASELWSEMSADLTKFYPGASSGFVTDFQLLGDATIRPDELRATIQRLIEHLQKA
jgi:Sir2- and TIR-associating SLOG family